MKFGIGSNVEALRKLRSHTISVGGAPDPQISALLELAATAEVQSDYLQGLNQAITDLIKKVDYLEQLVDMEGTK